MLQIACISVCMVYKTWNPALPSVDHLWLSLRSWGPSLVSQSSCSGRWGSSHIRCLSFACFFFYPAGWRGRHGSGHLDPSWEEWLHQPAVLQHIFSNCLYSGGGRGGCHGYWHPWLLCHIQRASEFAKSGKLCLVVLFGGGFTPFYLAPYMEGGKHLGCVLHQPYLFVLQQIPLKLPAPNSSAVLVLSGRSTAEHFLSSTQRTCLPMHCSKVPSIVIIPILCVRMCFE